MRCLNVRKSVKYLFANNSGRQVMRVAKFFGVIFSAFIILAAVAALPDRLCFEGGESYTFFCGTSSADCHEVTVGSGAALARLTLSEVCGESTVYKNFDLRSFLKKVNGRIVATEELSDSVNYYCTADLPYSVNLYGEKINLHISVRGETAKVASPIIFGGY